jgi:hypothetical protein
MNEEDCLEYNEKIMMQKEDIDYRDVMLEEIQSIQKSKYSKRK